MRLKVEKVDLSGVDKKLQRIGKRDDVGTFMATTVYRAYQEYVPREEGDLEDNITIEPYRITHNQPYAHRMHEGADFNFRKIPHPNACANWEQAGFNAHKTSIAKQIGDYIKKL